MKKIILLSVIAILFATSCEKDKIPQIPDKPDNPIEEPDKPFVQAPKVEGRVVVAYITYWGTTIPDATLFTHINYAFAELYMKAGVYQGFKLQGKEDRFRQIVNLKKQYPNLKISLSFTHVVDNPDNSQGGSFSTLSKSDSQRKAFAADCKAFIETWGIDGIDMDWEFPGISWSGAASDPTVDTYNHTLLMKELRETLGSNYLLTYAGYVKDKIAVTGGSKYIDIKAVDQYVDFVNLMTYDMDAPTADDPHNHHSALSDSRAYWDCVRTINTYHAAGVAYNKLVLGIPFYGRHAFSGNQASLNYSTILALDKKLYKIDNWDPISNTPYVTQNGVFFCGYDNPKSIDIKGKWAMPLGLKGMMYWQYDGDDSKGTLRKATWNAVMAN